MQRTWILVGAAVVIALGLYYFMGSSEPEIVTDAPGAVEQAGEEAGQAADSAAETLGDAATAVGETVQEGAEAVGEAVEGAVEDVEDAVEGTPEPAVTPAPAPANN